jgi:hypothetical protein
MCSMTRPPGPSRRSVMLMSWFIFLGAAVGVRENNHMGFDVLLYVMPPSAKKWLRMISDIVILAFGLGMVWYGGSLVGLTWNTVLPALGISGGWDYVPIVAGGILVILFSLERIVLRLSGALRSTKRSTIWRRPKSRSNLRISKRSARTRPNRPGEADNGALDSLRRLHAIDADRHADRILPGRLQLRGRSLYGSAAARRLPAAEFGHERFFAARHSLLHLFRRPYGSRRHRQPHRRFRRLPSSATYAVASAR